MGVKYYIPHMDVCKELSTSTKTQIVFEASMKTSSGFSLNDLLYTGLVVQPVMLSQKIRFQIPKFVFTGDVVKMFLLIKMNTDHMKFQRIFKERA